MRISRPPGIGNGFPDTDFPAAARPPRRARSQPYSLPRTTTRTNRHRSQLRISDPAAQWNFYLRVVPREWLTTGEVSPRFTLIYQPDRMFLKGWLCCVGWDWWWAIAHESRVGHWTYQDSWKRLGTVAARALAAPAESESRSVTMKPFLYTCLLVLPLSLWSQGTPDTPIIAEGAAPAPPADSTAGRSRPSSGRPTPPPGRSPSP